MANSQSQNPDWHYQPPMSSVPNQPYGFQQAGFQSPMSENMQVKTGQPVINGPSQGPVPLFRPPSNVNGLASTSPQGPGQPNYQLQENRPTMSNGPPVMNGPNPGQPVQGNRPLRPGMPPLGGQFRPGGPPQNFIGARPPLSQPPMSIQSAFRPPQNVGSPSMPVSSAGVAVQPAVSTPPLGHLGMTATSSSGSPQGMLNMPNSQYQGPPSPKSSRTNSPFVINQNLDALEGQFRGTPEQETQPPGFPASSPQELQRGSPLVSQQTIPQQQPEIPSSTQPGSLFSPAQQMPGVPTSGQPETLYGSVQQQPGAPPFSQPEPPYTAPQQPQGMPSSSQPRPPYSAAQRFPPPLSSQPPPLNNQGYPAVSQGVQFQPPQMAGHPPRPGFPATTVSSAQPGFPPMSAPNQRPGFPTTTVSTAQPGFPPTSVPNQRPGFPPAPLSTNQRPGFPPVLTNQRPGFPPVSANQRPGFPPAPISSSQQHPGFPPPPVSTQQQPRFPMPPPTGMSQGFNPPSSGVNQPPGFPPQPVASNQYRYPPPPTSTSGMPPSTNQPPPSQGQEQAQYGPTGKTIGEFVNAYPKPNAGVNSMTSTFNNMTVQGSQNINLLQQKRLLPPDGVEIPKPVIPNDNRNINCNPEVFRCTLNAIPQTQALLNKSRLPLGILIHPFKDLSQLPVIQSSVIVRCRSCRTYINPFVYFVDSRRWKCNLCYRVNELPDEFSFDPVTKTYGDPQRRPEVRSATIEFIAPSEYMLRPPQPAVYLFLLDVSFNAIETGYLTVFCETILDVLDRIPGDSRTHIGFIAYDSNVHFFNLADGLSQPQMLTVTDVEDIFLPCPDDLLVNLNECKGLVIDLLNQLPTLFENNMETRSALGAALQAAFKMMSATGGRVTVMQTVLPTHGPGALQNREDSTQKTSKDISSLGPATDFYKKLALDCSAQQIAVDLFMFNGQYADLASIECISKFSGGCVSYYPSYHAVRTPHLTEKFEADLRRYLTRKIGFESVMRIRCSKGISIHTFHGNFFVRSTDLLSLPNVNPDAGFGMQMSIEESLTDMSTMCFQAALLYTSSKGERRIRVHTLCLPVVNQLSDIHASADQQAIIALLAKMAADRSISASMSDAREAIVNAAIDMLNAYGSSLHASQKTGGLCINDQLKLVPLYCLALLKSAAFRTGISTRLDDRTYALHLCKTLPCTQLIQMLYPDLYPVHTIMEAEMTKKGTIEYPKLPLLQLSSANIDRNGAYLLDIGDTLYLYLGSAVSEQFCQDMLDRPNFPAVQEGGISDLPELKNEGSERLRAFIAYLLDSRPNGAALVIVREDGKLRMKFFEHFVEDRTEASISYIEFLQQIQMQVKS